MSPEDQDEQRQAFIGALRALGGSAGNGKLRDLLGWEKTEYEEFRTALLAAGTVVTGRGRGGSVSLTGSSASEEGNGARKAAAEPRAP